MKYQSQSVALPYFVGALVIFALQLVFGLIGATMYVAPNLIPPDILPFSVVRMIHTNALIVWLLLGFFGSTFYLLPEETERELYSPMLARIQFWVFFVARGRDRRRLSVRQLRRPLLSGAADLPQGRHRAGRLDVSLQHARSPCCAGGAPSSPTSCCSACGASPCSSCSPSTIRPTSSSTRCSGGGSCICGWRACGSW